jgi:hypothetical protein
MASRSTVVGVLLGLVVAASMLFHGQLEASSSFSANMVKTGTKKASSMTIAGSVRKHQRTLTSESHNAEPRSVNSFHSTTTQGDAHVSENYIVNLLPLVLNDLQQNVTDSVLRAIGSASNTTLAPAGDETAKISSFRHAMGELACISIF